MSRQPTSTDFPVDVPSIGRFMFARKSKLDIYKIRGNYNHLTNGNYDGDGNFADVGAFAFISIEQLLVSAPVGFDLDEMDPILDEDFEEKILMVWKALRDKELSFRPKPKEIVEEARPGTGEQSRTVVSGEVQSVADGPEVSGTDTGTN